MHISITTIASLLENTRASWTVYYQCNQGIFYATNYMRYETKYKWCCASSSCIIHHQVISRCTIHHHLMSCIILYESVKLLRKIYTWRRFSPCLPITINLTSHRNDGAGKSVPHSRHHRIQHLKVPSHTFPVPCPLYSIRVYPLASLLSITSPLHPLSRVSQTQWAAIMTNALFNK